MLRTLTSSEANALFRNSRLARLGCVINGEPYVVPVNYYLEDDYAYVHSLPGRKVDALRSNPRACLQVDSISEDSSWRSVLAYGNYEEITNLNERARIMGRFCERFPFLTPVETAIVSDAAPPAVIVFRLRISEVHGVGEN